MSDPPPSSAYTGFLQTPPTLHNPYTADHLLRRVLTRRLGSKLLSELQPEFTALAEDSISKETKWLTDDANRDLPSVVHWDGWGVRKDELRTSEGWRKLKEFWARSGMMEDFFTRLHGSKSRIIGFTKYHNPPNPNSRVPIYLQVHVFVWVSGVDGWLGTGLFRVRWRGQHVPLQ